MIKVSGSPRKVFTMLATPSKVVLAAPLGPSPMKSPIKQLRLSPVNEATASIPTPSEIDSSPCALDALPLLFDQPVPDMQVEPEHETRRRVSLQNARRSDRRSSGIRGLPALEVAQTAPNRRHSFLHTDSRQATAKGRRHTLGVFGVDSGEILLEVTSPATEVVPEPMVPQAPFTGSQAAVVVDVGTNLDIFGQGPEQPSSQRDGSPVDDKTLAEHDSHMEVENDDCPFVDTGSVTRHAASSPILNALGLMDYMVADADDVTTNGQAATSPPNTDDGIQQPDSDSPEFAIETLSPEMADSYNDFQENNMFLPQDPEGLSTIFEESFATDVVKLPEEGIAAAVDYEQATPCRQDASHNSPSSAARESQLEQTVSPPCTPEEGKVYEEYSSESNDIEEPATPTPAMLLADAAESNSEVYAVDDHEQPAAPGGNVSPNVPLGASAGPQAAANVERDQLPTSRPLNKATEISTDLPLAEFLSDIPWQSFGSPASSDDSVATPDDDFCGRIALDLESDVTQTALNLEPTTLIPAAPADEGVTAFEVSAALPHLKHPSSPSEAPESDVLASTPPKDMINSGVDAADEDVDAIPETPPTSNTGFTPINDRRISPPETGFGDVDDMIMETDELDDIQNDGIVTALDYQPTVPIEDITSNLADAISLQEDSETEMLRKFVTRVKADKSAKAAAAAALAKRNLRQKRRSGSTGSVTSTTGSPVSRCESPAKRLPLGEKDLNSPSPVKKRKAPIGSDGFFKGKTTLFSEESSPAPKTKRRRKRLAAELETTLEQSMSLVDPDPAAETGLRRSTRSRSTRVQLRPPAPSANSIALSMIPVRLPGSSGGMMADMDRDMPAIVIPNTRNEEKDLAAVTRLNTRKNKGNSVPPKMVLATQTEDPAAWRMKELKSVFEAREGREAAAGSGSGDSDSKSGRKCRVAKGVRWAEELARFQVQGAEVAAPPSSKSAASTVASEVASVLVVEEAEEPPGPPAKASAAAAPEEVQELELQQPPAAKKPPPKRTRASRLQMPTPIRNKTATPAPQPEKPTVQLPAKRSAAAAAAAASSSASSSVARMATRRTKIASLGMSANGTPAPKRRTRTTT